MMKVHTGLVGISNNSNARQRFFLASPVDQLILARAVCILFDQKQRKAYSVLSPASKYRVISAFLDASTKKQDGFNPTDQ